MRKIRTILVDDEPLARECIRLLIQDDAQIEIITQCANGREAAQAIDKQSPDLLFLDVQMPEINGFDVLNQINIARMPVVIFVTAYDNYALQAEARLSPDGKTLYFSSERVVPITYPRILASACQDLKRMEEWDNGNYNIWEVSLSPWLSDHQ